MSDILAETTKMKLNLSDVFHHFPSIGDQSLSTYRLFLLGPSVVNVDLVCFYCFKSVHGFPQQSVQLLYFWFFSQRKLPYSHIFSTVFYNSLIFNLQLLNYFPVQKSYINQAIL